DGSVAAADGGHEPVPGTVVSRARHLLPAGPHVGHLRPDGGLSSDERHHAAAEPETLAGFTQAYPGVVQAFRPAHILRRGPAPQAGLKACTTAARAGQRKSTPP